MKLDEAMAPRPEGNINTTKQTKEEQHFSQFEPGQLELEPEHPDHEEVPSDTTLTAGSTQASPERTGSSLRANNIPQESTSKEPVSQSNSKRKILVPKAPSSGMFKGFWQYVAPDPNADKELLPTRREEPAPKTAVESTIVTKTVTSSPAPSRQSQVSPTAKKTEKQKVNFKVDQFESTPAKSISSSLPITPYTSSDDEEKSQQRSRLLLSAQKVAESYGSPTPVWDAHAKIFNNFCNRSSLDEKLQKRLTKLLKKQPDLLTIRSSKLGAALPDGYSPLHAAAKYNNLDAAKILIQVSKQLSETLQTRDTFYTISCLDLNTQGQTALHVASAHGNLEMIHFLKQCWFDELGYEPLGHQAPTDLNGRTPLACAFFQSSTYGTAVNKMDQIEKALFSPGDRTVCPANTPKINKLTGTPFKGGLSSCKKQPVLVTTGQGHSDVLYAVAEFPGRRVIMEDSWSVVCPLSQARSHLDHARGHDLEQHMCFLGVFDGHADQGRMSRFIADKLPMCILQSRAWQDDSSLSVPSIEQAFGEACLAVDEQLRQSSFSSGGSTGVSAIVTPNHIIVANVGDSRAILVQIQTTEAGFDSCHVVALSHDHKPSLPCERARIEASGLKVVDETFEVEEGAMMTLSKVELNDGNRTKLASSRCFGDFDFKENVDLKPEQQAIIAVPEVIVHQRTGDDFLLVLACDGIWDVLTNDQVAAFLYLKSKGKNITTDLLESLTHALLNECFARKASDNLTAIICALSSSIDLEIEMPCTGINLAGKFAQEV